MDEARGTSPASAGHLLPVAAGAVGVLVAFRLGVLPGGLVAVDVLLALVGWWLGSAVVAGAPLRSRLTEAWRRGWPPLVLALVLAWIWVLTAETTRVDTRVRGEALGLVAGYGNWQLLALGPAEVPGSRTTSPLQALWLISVAVQLVLVFGAAWWATRPRARRRPDARDPLVLVALGLGLASLVVVAVQSAVGADGQSILLSTWSRGGAFFFGASVGALRAAGAGDTVRAVALGTRWIVLAMLAVLAVVAAPGSVWWTAGGALAVPVLAVLLVAAEAPWPPGRRSRAQAPAVDPWSAVVAVGILQGPALALAAPPATELAAPLAGAAGLVILALASAACVAVAGRLSWEPAAIERRCVLVPPLVVLVLVLLFSATGAFHWSGPQNRAEAAPASGPPR